MRKSGILMPISSLPSKYGIGTFGKAAYKFADRLKEAGQKYWQILPLGATGYGDSPYQSFSTFAGNPYFIDLEMLIDEGLINEEELDQFDFTGHPNYVDYERIYNMRYKALHIAYERWNPEYDGAYWAFLKENGFWLEDYALYMAIKNAQNGISFIEWDADLRGRDEAKLKYYADKYADEINFYRFLQYYFLKQWNKLKKYVNDNGIEIIGDIPIYVALDSADTWSNPKLFQFDEDGLPKAVAGCPPDAFSATGQLWGNPLYDWKYHKETGFDWWIKRMSHCMKLYDVVRVDHFRGFDSYYSIPYGNEDATVGEWEEGPGMELFNAMKVALGEMKIIAEDLGYLTPSVIKLVEDSGFPGMKVLQFAFDHREPSNYLPHSYSDNCVVYTGTHDNDTLLGWLKDISKEDKEYAKEYMNVTSEDDNVLAESVIRLAMSSVAKICIIPIQEYLGLGGEARINKPSTIGWNWKWRMSEDSFTEEIAEKIHRMTWLYGRL